MQQKDVNGKGELFVNSGVENFGIKGRTDRPAKVFPAGTITIDFWGNANYRDEPYKLATHNHVFSLSGPVIKNRRVGMYLVAAMSFLPRLFSYANMGTWPTIKKQEITLPVLSADSDEIDFDYMEARIRELEEARIRELEEARIRELEAYIKAAGFENCDLTEEEQSALDGFAAKTFKPFKIGALYAKCELRNKPFDKRKDTDTTPSDEFPVPLANAKHGDNGVMFYGRDSIFPSEEMTLDIVQNGAIATGDVYPQSQKTGVLWDAYLIKAIGHSDTERTLCYMAAAVEKAIKVRYNYDKKATWNRVKGESVTLPVDGSGTLDLSFMETFIRAQMKEAVRGVWAWRGRKIVATRSVASAPAASPEDSPHHNERTGNADYSGVYIAPTYAKAAQMPGAETAP